VADIQRSVYELIVVRGNAEVVNGDQNTCSCSGVCTCKPLNNGSTYRKIHIKSESAIVHNGITGTPNGSQYGHIENSKDDEDYKEDTSARIHNGSFKSEMDREAWLRKQRVARREQREQARKDRESGRG
jgi:hypothetical protein